MSVVIIFMMYSPLMAFQSHVTFLY